MLNDITIYGPLDDLYTFPIPPIVASGGVATIPAGTPTKGADATAAGSWTGAVVPMVDGDGTTSQRFTGISKNTSNDTASTAGIVEIWVPLPGIIYSAKAKTASLANTLALVSGLFGKRVVFDLTTSVWTVDSAASDASTNGITIVGGDYQTSLLYFVVSTQVTLFSAA